MKGCRLLDVAFEFVQERGLLDAAFKLVKGCGLQDTAFKLVKERGLQDAVSKVSHASRLKDFVESFNAKSALTVGDLCLWCFSELKSTYLIHTGFDIRVGIKADGFDFYHIN